MARPDRVVEPEQDLGRVPEGVERADLRPRLEDLAIDEAEIDPRAQIRQRAERATFLAGRDDRRPLELEDKPLGRVFYIRYHPSPLRRNIEEFPERRRRRAGDLSQSSGLLTQEPPDSLANLLKALQPHIYDIYTPDQFRKALADVMKEISGM